MRSEAAAQVFKVAAHTFREDFHVLSRLWKTSLMVIKPKAPKISPGLCCYSIGLYKTLIIVSVQGYLFLIDRVNLVLPNFKQHLLLLYCFTIKKAGLIVIKRKAFSNHTLFCTFAALLLRFFCLSFYRHTSLLLRQQTLSWFFHQTHFSSGPSLFYFSDG